MEFLSTHERSIFRESLDMATDCNPKFSSMITKLVDVPSRFNCRQVPNAQNLKQLIVDVARYEFTVKSLPAIIIMRSGVPTEYNDFWNEC